jgi:hypothetical protein
MITNLARRNTRLCAAVFRNQAKLFSSEAGKDEHMPEDDGFVKFTKTVEKLRDLVDPEDQRVE